MSVLCGRLSVAIVLNLPARPSEVIVQVPQAAPCPYLHATAENRNVIQ